MGAQVLTNPIEGSLADRILNLMALGREKEIYRQLPDLLAHTREKRRAAHEALRQAKVTLQPVQDELTLQDGLLMAELSEETIEVNGKEKPRFGNEAARKAELAKRRAVSFEYKQAKKVYDSAAAAVARCEGELMAAEDEVLNLEKQFRAIEILLDLSRAEMAVITRFGAEV